MSLLHKPAKEEKKLDKEGSRYEELKRQVQGLNPVDALGRMVGRESQAAKKARIKELWQKDHEITKVENVDWWKKKGSSPPTLVKKVIESHHKGPNGEE